MPPNWLLRKKTSDFNQSRTYDSYILLASKVQEILRRSDSVEGFVFLGIIVTYSFFQHMGHLLVQVMQLKISVRGIARKSENWVTSFGKISPGTVERGFLKRLMRAATSYS